MFELLRYFVLTTAVLAFVGCATTVSIDGRTFSRDPMRRKGSESPSERGFLAIDKEQDVCMKGSSTKIHAGYFVTPRPPRRGETETEYQTYLEAEKYRVRSCAKVGLWCATQASLFCRLDDEKCLSAPGGRRNTCHEVVENAVAKPQLHPVTETLEKSAVILCAGPGYEYTSPLHWQSHTRFAWSRDRAKWDAFCRRHRSESECKDLLQNLATGTVSYMAAPFDLPRWAVEILGSRGEIEVHKYEDAYWAEVEVDVEEACSMLDGRY